jgi:hypothetical protein
LIQGSRFEDVVLLADIQAADLTAPLKVLHCVIQPAMGWLDTHLWEFTANKQKYGPCIPNDQITPA